MRTSSSVFSNVQVFSITVWRHTTSISYFFSFSTVQSYYIRSILSSFYANEIYLRLSSENKSMYQCWSLAIQSCENKVARSSTLSRGGEGRSKIIYLPNTFVLGCSLLGPYWGNIVCACSFFLQVDEARRKLTDHCRECSHCSAQYYG